VIFIALSFVGAAVHLWLTGASMRAGARIVEVVLLYLLCVAYGLGAMLAALGNLLDPDLIAAYVGWTAGSPFQIELGFAELGFAALGVLSICLRGWFWVAPAVGYSTFLFGTAYVHVRENVAHGTTTAGVTLAFDVVAPALVLVLLVAHLRMRGATTS
jgi:hypothetical protein